MGLAFKIVNATLPSIPAYLTKTKFSTPTAQTTIWYHLPMRQIWVNSPSTALPLKCGIHWPLPLKHVARWPPSKLPWKFTFQEAKGGGSYHFSLKQARSDHPPTPFSPLLCTYSVFILVMILNVFYATLYVDELNTKDLQRKQDRKGFFGVFLLGRLFDCTCAVLHVFLFDCTCTTLHSCLIK